MKIVTVLGARPQFIKAAPVSRALAAQPDVEEVLIHTGQHFDDMMSEVFFREMGIPAPRHHLGIGGLSHGAMTGRMLEAIEAKLVEEKADQVLVYGDTNSTLAGALAAAKLNVPLAHVEAGLRSFNRTMPEEINRIVTDHVASTLFAPTDAALANLKREGVAAEAIVRTGDVMLDATMQFGEVARARSRILETLGLQPKAYLLATVHRAENTDDPERLAAILAGLGEASRRHPVVLPLHPRTRGVISAKGVVTPPGVRLVAPLGYLDMLRLEQGALLIATDSGGVQKEAFFQRVPCVTLRDETEWTELVEAGANRLAPPRSAAEVAAAVEAQLAVPSSAFDAPLYGSGEAAQQIARRLAGARLP